MGDTRFMAGVGMQPEHADAIVGTVVNDATAAGSAQGDAYAIVAEATLFTTVASSTGAVLPADAGPKSEYRVYNGGANALAVYPPSGGKINNGSADAAISVASGKGAVLTRLDTTNWGATFA